LQSILKMSNRQMSQSQVDEKTGKPACRQHTDGDLTKEMK